METHKNVVEDEEGNCHPLKNKQYYSIVNNLQNTWNNPYRVSGKFYRYYHMGNAIYKKTQPTDSDKVLTRHLEEQKARRDFHRLGREVQHEQLKGRKTYREALELASRLGRKGVDVKEKEELMGAVLRTTFVNPSKVSKLPPVLVLF
eukprot:TRINITY_DN4048_c0_g1_i3.p1 TRINITY_DN4048_c0_g1~~TRINITY_DN4048_c0_g1_i3.p1  ORF type:complete len:147 (+),score=22.03 TRINITY_DN4048_c0_g1_i3:101-541(+)